MGFLASSPFHSPPCVFDTLVPQGRCVAFPDGAQHLLAFISESPKRSLLSFRGGRKTGGKGEARPAPPADEPRAPCGWGLGCGLTLRGASSWPRTSSLEGLSRGVPQAQGASDLPKANPGWWEQPQE